MRNYLKIIVILILVSANEVSYGQEIAKIELIELYCKKVKNDTSKQVVHLTQNELGILGGYVDGYFITDSLVQVTHTFVDASFVQFDYYFKNDFLVYTRYRKISPAFNESNQNKKGLIFEEKYYYENDKVIGTEFYGKRSRRERKQTEDYALQLLQEYKRLIVLHRK